MTRRLTVLAGPSGVGKGTVVKALLARRPDVWLSVSATTRKPREGELDGVHYLFWTSEEFDVAVARGQMLEILPGSVDRGACILELSQYPQEVRASLPASVKN